MFRGLLLPQGHSRTEPGMRESRVFLVDLAQNLHATWPSGVESVTEWTVETGDIEKTIEELLVRVSRLERFMFQQHAAELRNRTSGSKSTSDRRTPSFDLKLTREELLGVLAEWQQAQGISLPKKYLLKRSTGQLRKMYEQIQSDSTYRVGRRWKVG